MIPAIIAGLVSLAPSLIKLFDSDEESTVAKVASVASSVARAVTGSDSDEGALAALKADPAVLLEYQRQTNEQAIVLYQEETKRLQAINETIRTETRSEDPFVRRWRPTFGYCMAATWTVQIAGFIGVSTYAVIAQPVESPHIIDALTGLIGATATMWAVALSVIGVSVWKRSDDKRVTAGEPGIFGALAKKLGG